MGKTSRAAEPKYYVYTLSYPPELGGHVFYVGKGQGSRIDHHEHLATRGVKGERYDVIRGIWRTGARVVKAKVFRTNDEREAHLEEHRLVTYYGFGNLTNARKTRETVAIPKSKDACYPFSLSISDELRDAIKAQAKLEGISASRWVMNAALEALGMQSPDGDELHKE